MADSQSRTSPSADLLRVALASGLDLPEAPRALAARDLAWLAELLAGRPAARVGYQLVERREYDETRPLSAPSSRQLVSRYGRWLLVCRAAARLAEAANARAPTTPTGWGLESPPSFTRNEVLDALGPFLDDHEGLLCGQYEEWVRRRRARARDQSGPMRIPYLRTVDKHFPEKGRYSSRWRAAIETARGRDCGRPRHEPQDTRAPPEGRFGVPSPVGHASTGPWTRKPREVG